MYSLLCFGFTSCRGQYYGKRIMHVYTLNIRMHTQNKDVWALWFFFTSNCFLKDGFYGSTDCQTFSGGVSE